MKTLIVDNFDIRPFKGGKAAQATQTLANGHTLLAEVREEQDGQILTIEEIKEGDHRLWHSSWASPLNNPPGSPAPTIEYLAKLASGQLWERINTGSMTFDGASRYRLTLRATPAQIEEAMVILDLVEDMKNAVRWIDVKQPQLLQERHIDAYLAAEAIYPYLRRCYKESTRSKLDGPFHFHERVQRHINSAERYIEHVVNPPERRVNYPTGFIHYATWGKEGQYPALADIVRRAGELKNFREVKNDALEATNA